MGQQELGRPVSLLLGQGRDAHKGGEEGPAQAQHVAALDGVVPHQGAKVQPIHAEGRREAAHGTENLRDPFHLPLHLRKEEDADNQEKTDCPGPHQQRPPPLAQFVFQDGHRRSPLFS